MIKPSRLEQGDTIAIISTARWVAEERLQAAAANIESYGFKAYLHPHNKLRNNEYAGSFKERAQALHDVWQDPDIKAVVIAAGGTRTLHLLDYVDFDLLQKHPKFICGYSDTTALLNSINRKHGFVTLHGADGARVGRDENKTDIDMLMQLMSGGIPDYDFSSAKTLHKGAGEGRLIGGNLCILNFLLGTEYAPDFQDAILFIEDEAEEIRNIDRMLLHLKRLGRLEQLQGLMIGGFTMTLNTGRVPFPYDLTELVTEMTAELDIPIITDAPFGHGKQLMPLPIGCRASLIATAEKCEFKLLETAAS